MEHARKSAAIKSLKMPIVWYHLGVNQRRGERTSRCHDWSLGTMGTSDQGSWVCLAVPSKSNSAASKRYTPLKFRSTGENYLCRGWWECLAVSYPGTPSPRDLVRISASIGRHPFPVRRGASDRGHSAIGKREDKLAIGPDGPRTSRDSQDLMDPIDSENVIFKCMFGVYLRVPFHDRRVNIN